MNIVEILKNCPIGIKLYSSIHGEVEFICVNKYSDKYPIKCKDESEYEVLFTSDGRVFRDYPNAECALFPSKTQRDWNKFRLPVNRGNIMMKIDGTCPFITTGEMYKDISPKYICGINSLGKFQLGSIGMGWTSDFYIPASEEAKKELFIKMGIAGYMWNDETLELEKIESKFKEGDIIDLNNVLYLTTGITENDKLQTCCLMVENAINVYEPEFTGGLLNTATLATKEKRNKFYSALIRYGYKYDNKQHKLVEQQFKPLEKVLVRNATNEKWSINLFSYYDEENKYFPYVCLDGRYIYCIPYEGNEYLLGRTSNIH